MNDFGARMVAERQQMFDEWWKQNGRARRLPEKEIAFELYDYGWRVGADWRKRQVISRIQEILEIK